MSRFRELPGVTGVTFDDNLPTGGTPRAPVAIRVAGQGPDDEVRNPYVNHHSVGPDYFEVMDILGDDGYTLTDGERVGVHGLVGLHVDFMRLIDGE